MNVLVLVPHVRSLEYAFFCGQRGPMLEARQDGTPADSRSAQEVLRAIVADCLKVDAGAADVVVIRSVYGGNSFKGTTQVSEQMLSGFAAMAAEAPIHVPSVHLVARAALTAMPEARVVMAFETAFFVGLPKREQQYGIADSHVRRFGYHGLYHQAAVAECNDMAGGAPLRTLSLCLEPQPELAAILGHRPVLVTSGATPLEGLPGETTCGELDPTIILTLARRLKWGPEQINDLLTRRSGLIGLLGHSATLGDTLAPAACFDETDALRPAPEGTSAAAAGVLAYRILLACGAGAAALGGVDRIVLSGRYVEQGQALGDWLARRLTSYEAARPAVVQCRTPLKRLLADQAVFAA